ncbi:Phosphatidylinositol 4,5-bisphosphate-binding protein SLM2, protein [Acrodontium crateriforme]|uniref:Phosphatidylinositol 4,5-bisphosphate-binding protein SLM2, protein n=1 Tax=Acrodontium crateriforme TaxID=150365 RepID=A0AAQ3M142_9PEZI|nr:Phosphatidylinositol 4,5-bisphosphate-binding protein SLM2, protein [Acrodontium crateriforme]
MSHPPHNNIHLGSVPLPPASLAGRGYGNNVDMSSPVQGNPSYSSPLSQSAAQQNSVLGSEDFDNSHRDAVFADNSSPMPPRSVSRASTSVPSRSNTLKKKSSMKRSGSKKSLRAGSISGLGGDHDDEGFHSAFYTPIPTQGSPTEVLANRFQAWRQLLKSLITYFREIQASYEARAKATHKVQSTLSNIITPAIFSSQHGLSDATRMLESYHQRSIAEANKSREIEADVIAALSGLRNDLGQKIKEIKSLNGDFKNSVEKEKDATRREVDRLRDALQHANHEDGTALGKNDPFVVRLGVDRAVERQIDEENYLHRAYLNLESSGRELESIVVGEIQKAYNALAGILKRESDDAYNAVESLRTGPISMPKDQEWNHFVVNDPHFVDPSMPLRRVEDINYPGRHDPQAAEVRAGMLERKSKYLKSYTPGWYVLSPTHLHEFKSADKIYSQPPVMSLFLPDQKLGSKSDVGSSSHKFMLKGRQSGSMHKGHNWVFRAESHDTMQAWFDDIQALTEKTPAERSAFVRKHARSVSGMSDRGTVSSDGMDEDEADAVPYSNDPSVTETSPTANRQQRPVPGGRFPSDLRIPQTAAAAQLSSPSSEGSDKDTLAAAGTIAAAGALSGSAQHEYQQDPYRLSGIASDVRSTADDHEEKSKPLTRNEISTTPVVTQTYALPVSQPVNQQQPVSSNQPQNKLLLSHDPADQVSQESGRPTTPYGNWLAPVASGAAAGAGGGILAAEVGKQGHEKSSEEEAPKEDELESEQVKRDIAVSPVSAVAAPALHEDSTKEGQPAFIPTPVAAYPTPTEGSPAATTPRAITPAEVAAVNAPTSNLTSEPTAPAPSAAAHSNAAAPLAAETMAAAATNTTSPIEDPATPTLETVSTRPTSVAPTSVLSGREREGARETGHIFPSVIRHNTDMSVSKLHVPGEYGS